MLDPMTTKIAFFGGARHPEMESILRSLQSVGYQIFAGKHDPREIIMLDKLGILTVESRPELVKQCQLILTCCFSPDDVEDLYLGEQGLLELMTPGSYAIDLSVSTPQLAKEIYTLATLSDVHVLDCPVLNVGEGEKSIAFIGGVKEVVEELMPLYPHLAHYIHPLEEPGQGQHAALMAIIGLAGSLSGVIEALGLSRNMGYDSKYALDALASTTAGSRALVEYSTSIIQNSFISKISIEHFKQYLDTALSAAVELDLTLPMVETAYRLCDLMETVRGQEKGIDALSLLYEDEEVCAEHGIDWELCEHYDGYDEDTENFINFMDALIESNNAERQRRALGHFDENEDNSGGIISDDINFGGRGLRGFGGFGGFGKNDNPPSARDWFSDN